MEADSMFRIAEVLLTGALNPRESRGTHASIDYPNRDDVNFLKHTLAYYNDVDDPNVEWFPVTLTSYAPVLRHY